MRLAAMADLHYGRTSRGAMAETFARAAEEADVVALCGDLTDYGLPEEAEILVDDLLEAVDEALKLESALGRLRTERRIALLHYAPIAGTVAGEPPEIYPFLGSSRLAEPPGFRLFELGGDAEGAAGDREVVETEPVPVAGA